VSRIIARWGGLAAAALLAFSAAPAFAGEPDLAAMQAQLDQMKADYEARIAALEARIARDEARNGQAPADAGAPADAADAAAADPAMATAANPDETDQPPDQDSGQPVEVAANDSAAEAPSDEPVDGATAQPNAMNPGVSVVLNGNYVINSRDPARQRIPGFELGDEAGQPDRGFSLAESELTFAANVDPFFAAQLTVAFDGQGEAGVEEAFIQTTALPGGLTAKAGRFFSGVGYLNERHAHNWSFIDMPLPYRAFLGGQYGDDGVELRWIAPVDIFLEFGAEAYRGDSFPAGGAANQGAGTYTAFVHAGADINDSWSWLAGLSYLHARADGRETTDPVSGVDAFSGDTDLGIVSGVLKWAPNGNVIQSNLVLSAEYFMNREDGAFNGVATQLDRSGWYGQAVYQFMPHFSVGLRYAQLHGDEPGPLLLGTTIDPAGNPWSASALFEYDSSEFGRFRAEYTRDESDLQSADEFWLQYTVVYGPHAAHRY